MAKAVLDSPDISMVQGAVRLAPHQVEAASRVLALLDEWGGAVLADATGLGKTFVAIAVARLHTPSLIVAPAGLRAMWRESLGQASVCARVESYEALSRGCALDDPRPALVVLDEAHHARNPKARRYAALADLTWGARVLLLTATPVHNRGTDLRALIALFLGSRAYDMQGDELQRVIVRRTPEQVTDSSSAKLPAIGEPRWVDVPGDPDTLRAIGALPPGVPTADGVAAHALLRLGLIRAWSSSEAALRETMRRRLRRAVALDAILESGRLPDRQELAAAPIVDGAVQLGFLELYAADERTVNITLLRTTLDAHVDGVRAILRSLDRNHDATDKARAEALRAIRDRSRPVPVVAFTQFVDTAIATYQRCARAGGVVLVTGRGARVASGHVTVDEIVRGFDVAADEVAPNGAMPLELLVASDVLSEGISLRRAGVLVHLDLPWTMARLEQRVGRLRRLGSKHSRIEVCSIGPPVSARELVPVMRALQRKARLATAVVGDSELRSSLPLLGQRLVRATAAVARSDGNSATERLRRALHLWAGETDDKNSRPSASQREGARALALISGAGRRTLVAVTDTGVTGNSGTVLDAVEFLSGPSAVSGSCSLIDAIAKVEAWLDEQRGRDLAQLAVESPSSVHATILRMLQDRLVRSTRTERATLGLRIERARRAVLAARGIGAENALARFTGPQLDLEGLERLLSRAPVRREPFSPRRLGAILYFDAGRDGAVSACVAD